MCLLLGRVDNARLKVEDDVCAINLWHWNESIVLLGASIDDILRCVLGMSIVLFVNSKSYARRVSWDHPISSFTLMIWR